MNEAIETVERDGLKLEILPDYDYRDDDSFTCPGNWHTYGKWGGYILFEHEGRGEDWLQHVFTEYREEIMKRFSSLEFSDCLEDYEDPEYTGAPYNRDQAEKYVEKWMDESLLVLPVYVYEHGGIAMSTGGYSCPWDSGQAGFIYVSKTEALKIYQAKKWSKKLEERALEGMKSYIKYLDAICQGSVYGWSVTDKDGDVLDSVWGYVETEYPMEKTYVYQEGMETLEYWVKKQQEAQTCTLTVEMTVFDTDEEHAKDHGQSLLEQYLDGTDFTGVTVLKARRDIV